MLFIIIVHFQMLPYDNKISGFHRVIRLIKIIMKKKKVKNLKNSEKNPAVKVKRDRRRPSFP